RRALRVAKESAVRGSHRRMICAVHLRAAVDQIEHKFLLYHLEVTRILACAFDRNAEPAAIARRILLCALGALCVLGAACAGGTSLFRQYEYEEEIYLSLD